MLSNVPHPLGALLLLLSASASLASPVGIAGVDQAQLPFLGSSLADKAVAAPYAGEVGNSATPYSWATSVDTFKTLLPSDDYRRLQEHVAGLPERRLLSFSDSPGDQHVFTEGQKALLTYHGIRFIDVTDSAASDSKLAVPATTASSSNDDAFPSNWTYSRKELEHNLYSKIDTSRMKTFLQAFSSFRTRYYRSDSGRQSQLYLLEKIHEIVTDKKNKRLGMTVEEFKHPWGQNSLIVRLPANDTESAKGTIVIGAHQDSTNLLPFLSAPGADDDGSGTTTVMEVMHILTETGFQPKSHNVEFHFYSAEEGGMLGSQAVVNDYQKRLSKASKGERVKAMLQMDMTAYVKPGTQERIGVIQDFVSPSLTKFVTKLIGEYNTIPSVETACKYACSDHSSWTKIGVPSAFAIEATFEDSNTRHIHTSGDTIEVDGFSFDHMAQFVRLASAFVLELSS